jgi:ketosteroid isomerase-like protein
MTQAMAHPDRTHESEGIETRVLDFFMALDTGDFETLIGCMAPDGVWHRQGKVLHGHGMIRDAMSERGSDLRTAHLVANFQVVSAAGDSAQARFYLIAYRFDGPVTEIEPSPMDLPFSIALCQCRCKQVDGDWMIAEMKSQPRFRRLVKGSSA